MNKDFVLTILNFYFVEHWDLAKPEQKNDIIPEIWEGHNIADYIDPDIMAVSINKLICTFTVLNCV